MPVIFDSLHCLDELSLKSKKPRKKKQTTIDEKPSLGIIDEEELEHIQSDAEEEKEDEEEAKEATITSDIEEEEESGIQGISSEPLYVLPLYAILSSDKQARVRFP